MTRMVRILALVGFSVLLTSACATKDWVREQLGAQSTETSQRFATAEDKANESAQRLESRIGEQAQRTEGLGARVNAQEASIGEVRGLAGNARDQANTAGQKADDTDKRLTALWGVRDKRTPVDKRDVVFGFNKSNLNDTAATALVSLVKELKENPKLSVALAGYTDPVGPREYNLELSQRRVEAVQRFLVEHDVELWRIHVVGLGPLNARDIPNKDKRRVTVTLLTAE